MKKKILIAVLLVIAVVGAYLGATYHHEDSDGLPSLVTGFGVLQSEVEFRNVYPGWNGSVPLTIINGNDRDRTFIITLEEPTKLKLGYEVFPLINYSWINITEAEVTIAAGGYHEIVVILAMPADASYSGRQSEIRIRVSDITQTGIVQVAVESRWYIITAA